MDALLFALAVIGIGFVVFWFLQNSQTPNDGETRGLLRYRVSSRKDNPNRADNPDDQT